MTGPQFRSPVTAVARNPLGRTTKLPLDILPISVRSPLAQSAELPSRASEGEGRKHPGLETDEDSLLASIEFAARVISSVLQNSDLKRANAMPVEEALALSLQEAATVCPDAFIFSFHRCSKLSFNFISFLQMATCMKSMARRVNLTEGSVKVVKVSKAKVSSLNS